MKKIMFLSIILLSIVFNTTPAYAATFKCWDCGITSKRAECEVCPDCGWNICPNCGQCRFDPSRPNKYEKTMLTITLIGLPSYLIISGLYRQKKEEAKVRMEQERKRRELEEQKANELRILRQKEEEERKIRDEENEKKRVIENNRKDMIKQHCQNKELIQWMFERQVYVSNEEFIYSIELKLSEEQMSYYKKLKSKVIAFYQVPSRLTDLDFCYLAYADNRHRIKDIPSNFKSTVLFIDREVEHIYPREPEYKLY